MQLVIPGLVDLARSDAGGIARYEVVPGATFEVHPLVALPADLASWGVAVIGAGLSSTQLRLLHVVEKTTEVGWPATIADSEVLDPETGGVVEHRLHALYRFLEYGGIAVVRARDEETLSQALEIIAPLLPHGRPDFTTDEAVALAQLWAYL
jgi:hypothetical protein